jgi:hypothetical protein
MNKAYAQEGVRELIRELCRLIDSGESMARGEFHDLCEQERFIAALFTRHKDKITLEYLNKHSPLCNPEILAFFNNALGRHANVVLMEDFGLKNNALLLGVNLCTAILHELEDATQ